MTEGRAFVTREQYETLQRKVMTYRQLVEEAKAYLKSSLDAAESDLVACRYFNSVAESTLQAALNNDLSTGGDE